MQRKRGGGEKLENIKYVKNNNSRLYQNIEYMFTQ